ncbi:MAG TPA: hypothetical protein VGH38_08165 [Bryobacteraceae bacterium]|jgi:hypothetical protein
MQAAELFVGVLTAYGLAGAVFAAAFVTLGIGKVDPVAAHAPVGFRLIVMPGAAALWPLLLVRWIRAGGSA